MEVQLTTKQKATVTGSPDLFPIMREILLREHKIGRSVEHFWMVGLNSANKILYIELVALGGSNMAAVNPRDAFRLAIYKLAVQVVLVHNHSSQRLEPSQADTDLTDHFIQAGKFLELDVLDHLIISEKDYYSFVDSGIFASLQDSQKYVPPYELERKAKQEKAIEMAKVMKSEQGDIEKIARYTQLSVEEIEKL